MGLLYVAVFLAIVSEFVHGVQGEDKLLRCPCVGRDLHQDFKWQTENDPKILIRLNGLYTYVHESYKDRIVTFLEKNISNCSILLKKITEADKNIYRCSFMKKDGQSLTHAFSKVILEVTQISPEEVTQKYEAVHLPTSRQNFTIIPIVALLLVMGCLWNVYLKRRRNWPVQNQEVSPGPSEEV